MSKISKPKKMDKRVQARENVWLKTKDTVHEHHKPGSRNWKKSGR